MKHNSWIEGSFIKFNAYSYADLFMFMSKLNRRAYVRPTHILQEELKLNKAEIFLRRTFAGPNQGDKVGGSIRGSNVRCPLTSNFDAKKFTKWSRARFWLPYFSSRQAVIKLIVQGGNTDK